MELSEAPVMEEVKRGFKKTEVGVIPEDWDVVPFGEAAHIERGKFSARPRNDPKYFGGSIPFIQTGDITGSNGVVTSYTQTLNDAGVHVSRVFPAGTLFFTIAANIGDVAIAEFESACPDSLVAITPKQRVDKRWLFHLLGSRKKEFEALATHNAQLNINLEKLRPYLLPQPPLSEQRAIATALSDVDGLLCSLDALIAKKKAIKQGAMQQLLTGKQRLPGFEGEWVVKLLGEVAIIDMGHSPSSSNYNRIGTGLPLIQGNADISERKSFGRVWTTQVTKECEAGALLMTVRAPVGAVAVATTKSCIGRGVCALRAASSDEGFLYHALIYAEDRWRVLEQGSTFTAANSKQVRDFELPMSPSTEEQTALATVLSDMDAELEALEARRGKTALLKQGMMQELLTGRTRLV